MKNFISKLFDQKLRSRTISYLLVIIAFIILQIMSSTGGLSSLLKSLLVPVCCYTVAAIGLNLNVGFSGELNLGQAGFMSVGAFTGICVSGVLASSITNPLLRLIIAIVAGALIAAAMGYIIGIPVLKLQGDYLAIVTLAFGQIIKSLITNMYLGFDENGLHMSFVENKVSLGAGGKMLLQGPMGATGTQRIATFTIGVILILCALTIVYNLIYSKSGRAIMGCRDNRIAAESIGINVANTKMLAFIISASLAGAAGALYGLNYSTLVPNKFDFNTSILILVFVVLGGLGNMTGTIISTTILMLLPELLRSLQDYRMLIYAVVLIVIMLVTNNAFLQTKAAKLRESLIKGKKGAKQS
ncbi:MAG: branched-chain amino acid ABC transporter permease [Solobacterium sp.]|nr:branched-chain amino acid ABC transporter permease [Solobacterium sp.]